ncbi:glycosyltransferase family 4 protein [Paracandidimonas soli]|uniref:Glycosyltransferase involved in cell wall biosynthesis n=1 Tax=Paracandidimonas soli TaxID=1917182 RepID=A0A4R3VGT6_9BURK|nr:glycosyltransferase family 4 protein [Paracandidimonas soli]TCV03243.1 glycosyltransferase involved in cell wall biosynthesis [Paracandidimonas soli]
MKILFCVSSMHGGGAERVAATLSSAWAERGWEVTLLATYSGRGDCVYPLHSAVKVRWLADEPGMRAGRMVRTLRKPLLLRHVLRQEAPDVIVSFLTNVNVSVLLVSRGLGVPVIVSERTNPAVGSSAGRLLRWLRRMVYRWSDMAVVQTEDAGAALRERAPGMRRLAVIPNPLPSGLPEAAGPGGQGERRSVVALGRLADVKRFDRLIEAFASLAGRHPQWDLRIWGEGPMRAALQAQIEHLGLQSRVLLPGRTDTPWQALQQADVFALTSRAEGFPNAMLEAMALGLPCVAVDCPSGPRELSQDGEYALLTPMDDDGALAANLGRLMEDAQLRQSLGMKAAASVRARYGLPSVLAQWDGAFDAVGGMKERQR